MFFFFSLSHRFYCLNICNYYSAAKSLQSCPILCDPRDSSPPGSAVPGILQARTLEWVAISFSNAWKWKVKVKSLSRVRLFSTPWTAAYQAPPSLGFSRQEYWSGVPLPSPTIILYTFNFFQNSMLHIARSPHSPFYFHFHQVVFPQFTICLIVYCCCSVAKLCLSLCDAMDCRPPGSSVHEISQARTLEWVAIPSPYLDLFHLLKNMENMLKSTLLKFIF